MKKIEDNNNPFNLGFGIDPEPSDPLAGGGGGLGGIPRPETTENYEQDPPSPEGMFEQAESFKEEKQQTPPTPEQTPPIAEQTPPTPEQTPPIAGGLKAGALVLLVFIGLFVFRSCSKGNSKRQSELEDFIKQQPSGGHIDLTQEEEGSYAENTQEEQSEPDINLGNNHKVDYITDIAKYARGIDKGGRTYLNLTIDNYGEYKVHIPYYEYEKLEESGYVLVDMEKVKDTITFVYISNKQENLKDLLNK